MNTAEFSDEAQRLMPQPDSSMTIGIVLGLLAGAIVAAFWAPQSGAQTRTLLQERGSALRERAATFINRTPSRYEPPL
jgi:gas vesicle protein